MQCLPASFYSSKTCTTAIAFRSILWGFVSFRRASSHFANSAGSPNANEDPHEVFLLLLTFSVTQFHSSWRLFGPLLDHLEGLMPRLSRDPRSHFLSPRSGFFLRPSGLSSESAAVSSSLHIDSSGDSIHSLGSILSFRSSNASAKKTVRFSTTFSNLI